jgi:hypothetical protein
MKKRSLFGFLRKKEEPVKSPVYGLTASEYLDIQHALDAELGAAATRQRAGAKEPSAYMKGLLFAIKLLESANMHVVGVEQ